MSTLHACHSRKDFKTSRTVQDGWKTVSVAPAYGPVVKVMVPNMVEMPDRGTKDCCYTLSNYGQKDDGCVSCSRRKQVA